MKIGRIFQIFVIFFVFLCWVHLKSRAVAQLEGVNSIFSPLFVFPQLPLEIFLTDV